ncbi:MAG: carbohydrate kinase family protein [Halanaerobiaceae bacterium]
MEIAVAGHICLDVIPEWGKSGIEAIKPGQLIEMDGIQFSTGGVVANTGLSLKKLGIDTGLIGKIGNDEIGKITLEVLGEYDKNVSESMIISDEELSSYTIVLNPPDTDRIFLHYPGTNDTFGVEDINLEKIQEAQIFHFGYPPLMKKMYKNEGEELVKIYKKTKKKGLINSLDMAMPDPDSESGKVNWPTYLKKVLPEVDIFLPSLDEILYMLEYNDLSQNMEKLDIDLLNDIGDKLINLGVKILVIKLGEDGIYLQTGNIREDDLLNNLISTQDWSEIKYLTPCFKVKAAGTTGAGDAAIAGFLSEMTAGSHPEKALITSAGVGAFCVEEIDATAGVVPLEEVHKRINKGWKQLPVDINLDGWKYRKEIGLWEKQN